MEYGPEDTARCTTSPEPTLTSPDFSSTSLWQKYEGESGVYWYHSTMQVVTDINLNDRHNKMAITVFLADLPHSSHPRNWERLLKIKNGSQLKHKWINHDLRAISSWPSSAAMVHPMAGETVESECAVTQVHEIKKV